MRNSSNQKLVSVCVITYNHENYLEQCLDNILNQETNFSFEVIVGEDCSTDSTADILNRYAQEHSQIKMLDNSKNLGVLPNFIRTLKACHGKYVAFCEGDDFWVDQFKLQKQVDFLENHTEYGGVATNNKWYLEKEDQFKESTLPEEELKFEKLCAANLINSQSILFRNELMKDLDWMQDLKIGDWPLHLLISNQKPYYRLKDICTAYRFHEGGVHSHLKEESKLKNQLEVLIAVSNNLKLNASREELLRQNIKDLLKKLISFGSKDVKSLRKQYFEMGGSLFNKTLLKSYLNDLF